MFEMDADKPDAVDYWCLAFYDKDLQTCYLVKMSEDCIREDVFPDGVYDGSLGEWYNPDTVSGLYHLSLNPYAHQYFNGDCEDWDFF